jgi:hypothetical protein
MPPNRIRAKLVYVPYVLLAASALASGGCLAVAVGGAVAATGAAAGYTYFRGAVASDYAAGFTTTWAATQLALGDLGMPAQGWKRVSESEGWLDSQTGDGKAVHIALETRPGKIPVAGPITEVQVRVGVLGDRSLSEQLLDRIQARLTVPPQAVPLPGVSVPPQTTPPPLASTAEPPLGIVSAGR